jgi:hypothetical protein
VGWLIALWMIDLVAAFKPPLDFDLLIDLTPDWRVMVFTLIVSFVTGALFGLAPALQASKVDLIPALKDEAGLGGYRRSRFRNGLVVAQVALSLLLLIAAGLIVRSLQRTQMIGPGFEVENRITMSADLSLQGYDEARGREFHKRLISRVESLPGVRAASYIGYLPLNMDRNSGGVYAEGQPFTRSADLPEVLYNSVWPRYFEAMGIALLKGRDFTMRDDKEESRVVIVNETFARRFWPGQDPIGKRLSRGGPDNPFFDVIGVVQDGKYWTLGEDPQPFVYFPLAREYDSDVALVVHTSVEPQGIINTIRREVERLDANLPLYHVKTMSEHLRFSLFPLRAGAWAAGSFALLALLLAGLGVYGVMAYAVEISRWRNHRYRTRWELAPWKGAGPKLWSVALPGLEWIWTSMSRWFLHRLISSCASGAEEHFPERHIFDPRSSTLEFSSCQKPVTMRRWPRSFVTSQHDRGRLVQRRARKQAAACGSAACFRARYCTSRYERGKLDANRRQSSRGHRRRNGRWPRDGVGACAARVFGSDQLQPVEK